MMSGEKVNMVVRLNCAAHTSKHSSAGSLSAALPCHLCLLACLLQVVLREIGAGGTAVEDVTLLECVVKPRRLEKLR